MIKLTSILENIVSEDYPQSFDMKFFKTLQSFASRKKYCDEHLKKIAQGSSRIVYYIDNEKVLKLAKNKKGLAQNEIEIDYSDDYMLTGIVAPVYDYHENFLWLEMAGGQPITFRINVEMRERISSAIKRHHCP